MQTGERSIFPTVWARFTIMGVFTLPLEERHPGLKASETSDVTSTELGPTSSALPDTFGRATTYGTRWQTKRKSRIALDKLPPWPRAISAECTFGVKG